MSNKKRSPLGTRKVTWSLTQEVIAALEQIRDESPAGETTSHFVEQWLRQHPQIKAKVAQQQERKE